MKRKSIFKRKSATINATSKISNSGKLVYEILNKKDKVLNSSDFSDFPRDSEKIDNICLEQITSCGFNNIVSAYYSKTHLNEEFGVGDISMLANKYVTYAIVTDSGKWYFGHSNDFGERIHTWLKDFRGRKMSSDRNSKNKNFNEELCEDARKYKRVLFICLAISDTEREAREKENDLIVNFVFNRFKEITNGEDPSHYSWMEMMQYVKSYVYNKVKAIANY